MTIGAKRLDVPKDKAAVVSAWARKVGVSHAHQPDGSLRLWGVSPKLREHLAKAVGPLSEAERKFAGAHHPHSSSSAAQSDFDEAKHPRVPKGGGEHGGEFRNK